MHLRSLRLRGFKSFPDPVEIRLEPGVAVVVGPNGSGKSNVSDAMLWATGTLAPSELRAEKPDDVLFAGSAGRARADFCEVELVFDNEDGTLGELPFSEVALARRLHRGGEGQYLLNGGAVRRIDLVELLSEVGLAGGASIIGQGRVEEILASKPEERRALLEEAAGLGRFKRRKHRAELKLARVAVQVDRALDLEAEVRKRLRPLALQATAAERAEKLGVELARLDARIAQLDLERHEERLSGLEERRTAAQLERKRAETRLEDVLGQRRGAEEELADAAGKREAATAALYRLRSATERLGLRREAAESLAAGFEASLERAVAGPPPEELEAARTAVAAATAARDREHRLRTVAERLGHRAERAQALLADVGAELAAAEEAAALDPARLEREAEAAVVAAREAASERDTLAEQTAVVRNRLEALDRALAEREGLAPAAQGARRAGRAARALADRARGRGGEGARGGAQARARRPWSQTTPSRRWLSSSGRGPRVSATSSYCSETAPSGSWHRSRSSPSSGCSTRSGPRSRPRATGTTRSAGRSGSPARRRRRSCSSCARGGRRWRRRPRAWPPGQRMPHASRSSARARRLRPGRLSRPFRSACAGPSPTRPCSSASLAVRSAWTTCCAGPRVPRPTSARPPTSRHRRSGCGCSRSARWRRPVATRSASGRWSRSPSVSARRSRPTLPGASSRR